jgi:DNA-binding transcriptional LysR family regulator
MPKVRNWDSRIGRRVRLRDLHVLFAAVQQGSMAKAGTHLGMSQSAVSQSIAALEHALQVPLLDRTPRGVELTVYGAALTRRGQAAFDELRSGVKEIEFLADPTTGEVRVACTESIAAGVLPSVIERFSSRYPKVRLHVLPTAGHETGFAALHERKVDVVLTLPPRPLEQDLGEQLHAEVLFSDRICFAAASKNPLARRRRIDLTDLADAALISPASDTPGGAAVIEAFRRAGLASPVSITTFSVHLRSILAMSGRFIAVLPVSILRFNPGFYSLRELPLDVPMPQPPALIVTLRNRTLSPPVERFVECAREVAKAMHAQPSARKAAAAAATPTAARRR